MERTFGSKPLGYYLDFDENIFAQIERDYGSHLERMDRGDKLQLYSILSLYNQFCEEDKEADIGVLMSKAVELAQTIHRPETDLEYLAVHLTPYSEAVLLAFLNALSAQLRLDYE